MFKTDRIMGNLVVVEGIDRFEVSVQTALLYSEYLSKGTPVIRCKEPTDSPLGSRIRDMLMGNIATSHRILNYLFYEDRKHHLETHSYDLTTGNDLRTMVCSHYTPATYAYQGEGLPVDTIKHYHGGFPIPGTIIFIDTCPKEYFKKLQDNNIRRNIYEELDILENVNARYQEMLPEYERAGAKLIYIDGCRYSRAISDQLRESVPF